MNAKTIWKGFIRVIIPFVLAAILTLLLLQSCQKEVLFESEEIALKSVVATEIMITYPQTDVLAGEDFTITYSSSCGKIMLEIGYVLEYDAVLEVYNKVYTGLSCETENLQWESVGEDVFITCAGESVTLNLENPGTYVYRAKLNMKSIKKSGCQDCIAFLGNLYECFTITIVEGANTPTFTDERDGKVYKIVTIGNQTWMAENLAYQTEYGSYAYGNDESNVAVYGRLYTWWAAQAACPAGWHVATNGEWTTLIDYLTDNGYGYEGDGDDVGKALASQTGWQESPYPGYVGNDQASNNASGFNALPAGNLDGAWYWYLNQWALFWTATQYSESLGMSRQLAYFYNGVFFTYGVAKNNALSVRCVKD
ncbi:MAG: fibrobacter succinogenes major paralogous domain-containing protein [Lentimicrobium sp.]|nr:fibrobacter succinogenes major paralogous domain-containing protein [Lentimicrobium sp.]